MNFSALVTGNPGTMRSGCLTYESSFQIAKLRRVPITQCRAPENIYGKLIGFTPGAGELGFSFFCMGMPVSLNEKKIIVCPPDIKHNKILPQMR